MRNSDTTTSTCLGSITSKDHYFQSVYDDVEMVRGTVRGYDFTEVWFDALLEIVDKKLADGALGGFAIWVPATSRIVYYADDAENIRTELFEEVVNESYDAAMEKATAWLDRVEKGGEDYDFA